ncbi:hypothetical protein B0H13DRAFT_1863198 [Mycena leptocephala]|nr:hypothetical protein B0H13DRAFT_1863198 [Mycena leptocephala]
MYDTRGEISGWKNRKECEGIGSGGDRWTKRVLQKAKEAGMHVPHFRETTKVPLLCPFPAGSGFRRGRRHLRDIHGEVHCAEHSVRNSKGKAQSPDGMPAQRVERVKEGWDDVRASTGKRGTATHDPRVRPAKRHPFRAGKCPLRRTSRTETCKREAPNSASPQSKKERKERPAKDRHSRMKQLPTSIAMCGPGRREQRRRQERTGGAVVPEDRPVLVVFGGAFKRVGVYMKESASCEARKAPAREGGGRAAREGEEGGGGRMMGRHGEPRDPPSRPVYERTSPLASLCLDAEGGALATTTPPPGRWGGRMKGGVYARDETAELLSAGRGPRRTGRARMEHHGLEGALGRIAGGVRGDTWRSVWGVEDVFCEGGGGGGRRPGGA